MATESDIKLAKAIVELLKTDENASDRLKTRESCEETEALLLELLGKKESIYCGIINAIEYYLGK